MGLLNHPPVTDILCKSQVAGLRKFYRVHRPPAMPAGFVLQFEFTVCGTGFLKNIKIVSGRFN